MFFFWESGDDRSLIIGLLVGLLTGAICGAVPLGLGLTRGHQSMAWMAFGFCVFLGVGCFLAALIPAFVFTLIVLLTEPIEKRKKKKGVRPRRRRRERADDFLERMDADYDRRERQRLKDEEDERPRRRRYEDEDDEGDDRPRRGRYR
jgi:hypothetical protein